MGTRVGAARHDAVGVAGVPRRTVSHAEELGFHEDKGGDLGFQAGKWYC